MTAAPYTAGAWPGCTTSSSFSASGRASAHCGSATSRPLCAAALRLLVRSIYCFSCKPLFYVTAHKMLLLTGKQNKSHSFRQGLTMLQQHDSDITVSKSFTSLGELPYEHAESAFLQAYFIGCCCQWQACCQYMCTLRRPLLPRCMQLHGLQFDLRHE